MSELHRDGVIETRNRRIAILNRDALSRRALLVVRRHRKPVNQDLNLYMEKRALSPRFRAGSRMGP
jgi:hypothetical protein